MIGILGSGVVARTLASAWASVGHEITIGSRDPMNEDLVAWAAHLHVGTADYADAAASASIVVNATAGAASLAAIDSAGASALVGKVVIDVANPLDFTAGFPPRLLEPTSISLAEAIQQSAPEAKVVKALNTVSATVMVDPASLGEAHTLFVCGDDDAAKATVLGLLEQLGWPREWVMDLGDLSNARGTEAWLLLWTRLYGALGTACFNVRVVGGRAAI